jgi:hypothetical protein
MPGHPLIVNFWWCVKKRPAADYLLRLQLLDDSDLVVSESVQTLSRPDYLPSQWQKGELIRSPGKIDIPARAVSGTYNLRMSLLIPESDEVLRAGWPLGRRYVTLGPVQVTQLPMETELPPLEHPLRADFGRPVAIELHGYGLGADAVSPGDALNFDFFWRSVAEDIPTSYKVLLHMISDSDEIIAQGDGFPVAGFRPTTSWRPGEVIKDTHLLSVPVTAPSGLYRIWAGFYDANTGERLAVFINGEMQPDGRLLLQTIEVE